MRGRLEAAHAAKRGWYPHAAAEVAAQPELAAAVGDGGGLASRAAARRPRQIPGVVRAAEDRVVGFPAGEQLEDVGLAHDDGPRLAKPPDQRPLRSLGPVSSTSQP